MTDQAMATASGGERSGRREQNKAENRAALLKAARSVFSEMGYGAAGVRDIVRRTDLASGTFTTTSDKSRFMVVREMSVELLRRHRNGRARHAPRGILPRPCPVYLAAAKDPEILAFDATTSRPSHDDREAGSSARAALTMTAASRRASCRRRRRHAGRRAVRRVRDSDHGLRDPVDPRPPNSPRN